MFHGLVVDADLEGTEEGILWAEHAEEVAPARIGLHVEFSDRALDTTIHDTFAKGVEQFEAMIDRVVGEGEAQ